MDTNVWREQKHARVVIGQTVTQDQLSKNVTIVIAKMIHAAPERLTRPKLKYVRLITATVQPLSTSKGTLIEDAVLITKALFMASQINTIIARKISAIIKYSQRLVSNATSAMVMKSVILCHLIRQILIYNRNHVAFHRHLINVFLMWIKVI